MTYCHQVLNTRKRKKIGRRRRRKIQKGNQNDKIKVDGEIDDGKKDTDGEEPKRH